MLGDGQGGASRMTSGAGALTRKPAVAGGRLDGLSPLGGEHDPAEQSAAADVVDGGCCSDSMPGATSFREPRPVVRGRPRRSRPQYGQRRRRTDRVAAEGAAVQAGRQQLRGLAGRQAGADRQAAAETLGQRDDVGGDAVVLMGEKRSGAAHPGLHLVENQQRAVAWR